MPPISYARHHRPKPSDDPTIERQDLGLQHPQLDAKGSHAFTRHIGQASIGCVRNYSEQLLDAGATDPRDDPELRHMSTDRIDYAGLLTNQEMVQGRGASRSSY
jgi:hypothetical protein